MAYDNRTCVDRDECSEWGFCDQLCTNTDGGYVCSCAPGYVLSGKNRCFSQNGSSPLELIFAHEKAVYRMNARGTDVRIIANSTGASGVDFHYQRNMLYWSDAKTKRVSTTNHTIIFRRDVVFFSSRFTSNSCQESPSG